MENSSKNFSGIFIFRVVTQAVLLENSSIKNHEYLFSFSKKMDEFSSKTACVTTRKMKMAEQFLDEFPMICY